MAVVTAVSIGAAATIAGTALSASAANKQMKAANRKAAAAGREVEALKASRQEIINPYSNVENLSGLAKDLTGMMNNPFAQLGVATKAAEIQMEQTDMALANTLDTLRSTGASAGGATALAQAALQSKKGVAASIEQQEANNEQLRAQGEANLQNIKMSEAQRVQQALMGEQGRLQQADVSGRQFVYGEQERRETEQLNRKQAQITGQQQAQVAADQSQAAYISSGISAVGNIGAAAASNPNFGK